MWFVRSTMWVLDTDSVLYQWQDGNQVRMMKPHTSKEKMDFFSWWLFPLRGCGECAGAYPSCLEAEAGYIPGWDTSSLKGPMWAFEGLVPCSRAHHHCSEGVLAPPPATKAPSKCFPHLRLEPRTLHFSSQSSFLQTELPPLRKKRHCV